jgi:hypothetical protein
MQEYQEEITTAEVPVVKRSATMKKFAGVLFVALIGLSAWAYYQRETSNSNALAGKKLTDAQQKALVSDYLAQVGRHMLLPLNDEPVIATVDDPATLIKQQAFFTGSIKGDVVLIFPKTQRAILYSPSRNKIVNAGPIITGNQNKAQSVATSSTERGAP